jgi:hypothetical protein
MLVEKHSKRHTRPEVPQKKQVLLQDEEAKESEAQVLKGEGIDGMGRIHRLIQGCN